MYHPSFSLARYAAELDVSIEEIYSIVDHLIYWAKVKVIYPISESNVYIINPATDLYMYASTIFEKLSQKNKIYV